MARPIAMQMHDLHGAGNVMNPGIVRDVPVVARLKRFLRKSLIGTEGNLPHPHLTRMHNIAKGIGSTAKRSDNDDQK